MKSTAIMFLLVPSFSFAAVAAPRAALPRIAASPLRLQAPTTMAGMSLPLSALGAALSAAPLLSAPAPALSATPIAQPVPAAATGGFRVLAAAAPLEAPTPQDPAQSAALPAEDSPAIAEGRQQFDGSAASSQDGVGPLDLTASYRGLNGSEQDKLRFTLRSATRLSEVLDSLNNDFKGQSGYYLIDNDPNARYMAAAARDTSNRPVIILTHDLLNRFNGRSGDIYTGAPWEFIASVIGREQVFFSWWYEAIPASADKLAASFMNMVRVFVDLTNGTSRAWATDKDFKTDASNSTTYVQWNWFEQLVIAARAAAQGVGTDSGHLIDSNFFAWARDFIAPQDKAHAPAFQYSLWEQFDGKYYRPGDAKNGHPLPSDAPRIDKETYDKASQGVYGVDGKGSDTNNHRDQRSVFGWIIQWLENRFEI